MPEGFGRPSNKPRRQIRKSVENMEGIADQMRKVSVEGVEKAAATRDRARETRDKLVKWGDADLEQRVARGNTQKLIAKSGGLSAQYAKGGAVTKSPAKLPSRRAVIDLSKSKQTIQDYAKASPVNSVDTRSMMGKAIRKEK